MIKNKKLLIFEIIAILIEIGLIVCVFLVDINFGIFKFVSQKTLLSQYDSINTLDTKLTSANNNYETSIKSVEIAKSDYEKEKAEYDAISDETISIIKEATTDETYNIEYMWIKIGNYASSNNLTLVMNEPGGTSTTTTTTTTDTTTTTTTTSDTAGASSSDLEQNNETITNKDSEENENNDELDSDSAGSSEEDEEDFDENDTNSVGSLEEDEEDEEYEEDSSSSTGEFTVKVKGNYLDISDFIFELENDSELRFRLDKITMEYSGSNQITVSFAVKNLKFIK